MFSSTPGAQTKLWQEEILTPEYALRWAASGTGAQSSFGRFLVEAQLMPHACVATQCFHSAVCSRSSQYQVQNELTPDGKKDGNPMWLPKLVLGLIITSVVYNTFRLIMSHISITCKGHGFSLANVFHELMAAVGQ